MTIFGMKNARKQCKKGKKKMEKLNYDEFLSLLMNELDKRYPDMKKRTREIIKINEKKQGILIECGKGICATIYPLNLYDVYERVFEEPEFMEMILENIDSALQYEFAQEYKRMLYRWCDIKQYVKPFVFNLEKNQQYIEDTQIVFKQKLNLAYSCFVEFPEDKMGGSAQINISRNLLELWQISEEELFRTAETNATFCIQPMQKVIEDLMRAKTGVEIDLGERNLSYVISTPKWHRGAAGMLWTELLEKHAEEMDDSFYILPCSIHEAILVNEADALTIEELKCLVQEVNEMQVVPEDYLADSVYYYNRYTKEVTIVA